MGSGRGRDYFIFFLLSFFDNILFSKITCIRLVLHFIVLKKLIDWQRHRAVLPAIARLSCPSCYCITVVNKDYHNMFFKHFIWSCRWHSVCLFWSCLFPFLERAAAQLMLCTCMLHYSHRLSVRPSVCHTLDIVTNQTQLRSRAVFTIDSPTIPVFGRLSLSGTVELTTESPPSEGIKSLWVIEKFR